MLLTMVITGCKNFKSVASKFMILFGTQESGNGQLTNPLGITVHNDKVYVAERDGKRISVFQLDGQFSGSAEANWLLYCSQYY